jgi:hypothetical protein
MGSPRRERRRLPGLFASTQLDSRGAYAAATASRTAPSSRSLREKQLDSRSCVSLRQRATWSWSTTSMALSASKPAHRRCMLRHYVHNNKQMQLGF